MSVSIAVKSSLASVLYYSGIVTSKIRKFPGSDFFLLMFHRVLPRESAAGPAVQPGMYVTPKTLGVHIGFLKKHFKIVALTELALEAIDPDATSRSVDSRNGSVPGAPRCALTFDDGWLDFYEHAFPILAERRVPATVFLPTDFIGTDKWFWTDRIARMLMERDASGVARPSGGRESMFEPDFTSPVAEFMEASEGSASERLERAIRRLKRLRNEEIEKVLDDYAARWEVEANPPGRAFLSWSEVREMFGSGLITFGSHTASHRILTMLGEREVVEELNRSRDRLIAEGVADPGRLVFSYPNGNYNEAVALRVKEAGYSLAVTTERGWNGADSDPYLLRRIGVHEDIASSEALLACRVADVFRHIV